MSIVVGNSSPTAAEHSLCELNGPQQLNTARGTMRFAEAPEVCGLCLFTYLSAVTAALTLRVHQDRVNGTAGHSVLLPVSYTVPDPHGYLRITWTGGGNASVCMEYTCFSGQECHLSDSRSHTTVSKPCKHRALLFPENASLLLRDLQINDSGIYELSIVHSTGTEKGNLTLEVRPATESAIDTGSGIHAGITAVSTVPGNSIPPQSLNPPSLESNWRNSSAPSAKPIYPSSATDRIPVIKNEFIIPPVVFTAAVIIILCLVVKTRREFIGKLPGCVVYREGITGHYRNEQKEGGKS
ncbi:uncharacterized protein [Mobula birostris]|uniref:uncharacterized protein isoform X2 n=1 Tax=Mobula birostris TaxID=1983395 RepID=UPI003B28B210